MDDQQQAEYTSPILSSNIYQPSYTIDKESKNSDDGVESKSKNTNKKRRGESDHVTQPSKSNEDSYGMNINSDSETEKTTTNQHQIKRY